MAEALGPEPFTITLEDGLREAVPHIIRKSLLLKTKAQLDSVLYTPEAQICPPYFNWAQPNLRFWADVFQIGLHAPKNQNGTFGVLHNVMARAIYRFQAQIAPFFQAAT
jgi:hypothetical protein